MTPARESALAWPQLDLDQWLDTYATMHLWTQMLGKTSLALSPRRNHWWHVALQVTARGIGTPAMPYGGRSLEVELDLVQDSLVARTSDGASAAVPLTARPVADFYHDYRALLRSLDVDVPIWPMPVEIAGAIPFTEDSVHSSYDADAVRRCWQILLRAQGVMQQFRGAFVGKCSPVHFWWGAFDLACTRFSGRTAPPHPGGMPNVADWVARDAYSHECISAGWWPGTSGGPVHEPAFYAYAYPEPPGCPEAPVRPDSAYYSMELREWVLPYDAVRRAADPEGALLEFMQSTYEVAANLGAWDRRALEQRLEISD